MKIEFPRKFLCPCDLDKISQMQPEERLLLYTFVVGIKPERVLEIGRSRGGSSAIIVNALDFNKKGRLVSLDPALGEEHKINPELQESLEHRATFLTGTSPDKLQECRDTAGGLFELVLVDGDHSYKGVKRDIKGICPHLADGAYVLHHDAYNGPIRQAIDESLQNDCWNDLGMLSVNKTDIPDENAEGPNSAEWGGIRVCRYRARSGYHQESSGSLRAIRPVLSAKRNWRCISRAKSFLSRVLSRSL